MSAGAVVSLARAVAGLGDARASNDDANYTGDVSASAFSLDYYRTKAQEFQNVLNALDSGYRAAQETYYIEGVDPETLAGLDDLMREYEGKRTTLRVTAEAINAGAAAINAVGGRFPSLAIPQTLGLAPLVPVAVVAAIGTAAALIVWGREWLQGLNLRLKRAQLIAAARDPENQGGAAQELISKIAATDQAIAQADASPVSALAPILKWGAIALGAWFAWKAFERARA